MQLILNLIIEFDSVDWQDGLAQYINKYIKTLPRQNKRFDFVKKQWHIMGNQETIQKFLDKYKEFKPVGYEDDYDINDFLTQFEDKK